MYNKNMNLIYTYEYTCLSVYKSYMYGFVSHLMRRYLREALTFKTN